MSALEICHNIIYHRYEGKERLEEGLQNKLSDKFKLTKGTTMCYGQLHQYFGLLGNTAAASKVLEGTYIAPEVSSKIVVGMLQVGGPYQPKLDFG